jgi:hypothetical protein
MQKILIVGEMSSITNSLYMLLLGTIGNVCSMVHVPKGTRSTRITLPREHVSEGTRSTGITLPREHVSEVIRTTEIALPRERDLEVLEACFVNLQSMYFERPRTAFGIY